MKQQRWMVIVFVPIVLLLWSSASGWAQTVPTPNASIVALQTRASGLEGQLPGLKATEQAARDAASRAMAVANQSAGAVQQTQSDINNTNAAINAGYGQQALELAGRSQDSLNAAQATLTAQGEMIKRAVSDLDQLSDAYQAAVPAISATAQAVVASAGQAAQQAQIRSDEQLREQGDRYQSERTAERVVFGMVLLVAAVFGYLRTRRAATPSVKAGGGNPEPLSDRERLPNQPVEFVNDEGLGEYFEQSNHS